MPAVCDTVYKSRRFSLATPDFTTYVKGDSDKVNARADELLEHLFVNDDGMFSSNGTFFFSGTETGGLYRKENDAWKLNHTVLNETIVKGFPLGQANKIFHFHSTGI